MWHAARVQEKAIKSMLIDYQKRADRRRVFYEQMKQEPTNFLQLFGRCAKINLETSVAIAAESPQIMQAWQGNTDIMIDRYDVRSNIDNIPVYDNSINANIDLSEEEARCNYERYRILVQNDAAGVTEDDCLKQIYMDEQFGAICIAPIESKKTDKKAAIGYVYDETGSSIKPNATNRKKGKNATMAVEENEDDDSSDGDMDLDNILDIDLLTTDQEIYLDKIALNYGIKTLRYSDFLEMDRSEIEEARNARLLEQEKAQYSGRKSRRERRIYKEKKLKGKQISPPSYAKFGSRNGSQERCSTSRSRSPASAGGTIKFIRSFGVSDDTYLGTENPDEETAIPHGPFLPGSEEELLFKQRFENLTEQNLSKKCKEKSPKISFSSQKHNQSKIKTQAKNDYSRNNRSKSNKSEQVKPKRIYSSSSRSNSRTRRKSRSRSRRRSKSKRRSRSKKRSSSRSRRVYKKQNRSRSLSKVSRNRSRNSRSLSRQRIRRRFHESKSRSTDRGHRLRESRSRSKNKKNCRSISRSKRNHGSKDSRSRSTDNHSSRLSKKRMSSNSSSSSASKCSIPLETLKRYRRPSLSSHSGLEDDEEDTPSPAGASTLISNSKIDTGNKRVVAVSKSLNKVDQSTSKARLQQKLSKKIQQTLTRHYAADKQAQIEKQYKEEQQKLDREEDLRLLSLQLRARDLEKKIKEHEELEMMQQQWNRKRRDRSRSRSRHRTRRSRSRSSRRPTSIMKLVDY